MHSVNRAVSPRALLALPFQVALTFLFLFGAAFALYVRAWPQAPVVSGDAPEYLEVAADLTDGRLDYLHDRPVGLPILIVATGGGALPTRALFFVLLLCHFVSIWLLAVALRCLGVSTPLLLLFGGILLLPPYVERAGYVLTEGLSELTLAVAFVGILMAYVGRRLIWLVAGSFAVGISALVRPVYEFLAPTLIAALFAWTAIAQCSQKWHRAWRIVLGLFFPGVAIVLSYCQFNQSHFGFFGVSPRLGYDLSTRTVSVVERLPEKYARVRELLVAARDRSITKRDSAHTGSQYVFGVREELSQVTGLEKHVALSRYLVKLNLELIRRAPLNYVNEVLRTMGSYWMPEATGLASFGSRFIQSGWAILHFLVVGTFLMQAVAVVGYGAVRCTAWLCRRRTRSTVWGVVRLSAEESFAYTIGLAVVVYTFVLSCAVGSGDARYRFPTDAIILFLTVLGVKLVARWGCQVENVE